jgi:anti-anti-sigma factor
VVKVRISIRFNEEVAIMSLTGKFMAGGDGPFLRQKVKDLLEAGSRKLLLDFSGVPYIDSTGLGFLAGSRATVESAGAKLVLAGVNPHVRKVLDDLKLSPLFDILPNESAGIARLQESGGTHANKRSSSSKSGKS